MINTGHPTSKPTPSRADRDLGFPRPTSANDAMTAAARRARVTAALELESSRRRENRVHDDDRLAEAIVAALSELHERLLRLEVAS